MRILLAWELGGNYGHLSKLLCVARFLRQRGHHVFFVVKNLIIAKQLLDSDGFYYVQAPRAAIRKSSFRRPVSFADILAGAGFGSFQVLDGLVQAWQELFRNIQPDVVFIQYAPVAQFAARLSHLPCLSVNTGFECPPDAAPFPCFRTDLKTTRDQLLTKESEILNNVKTILYRQEHHCCCSSLQEILKSDLNLLATLPDLDHYPQRRNGRYTGPISMLDDGLTILWRERKVPRVFVYLRPFPDIGALLDVLAGSGADVIAHIPAIDDKISANYANTSVRITTSMVKLSGLLADMDLAITHAGHDTACAILLAGVPLMMIPTTIEQWLMSRNIEYLGCGLGMGRKSGSEVFTAALEKFLADGSAYRGRAQKVAAKYATHNTERVIARIVNTIEGLPAWIDKRGSRGGSTK
jgi:UDP:flavonoid glycosyltransferase YjiC (YdhE family)